MYILKQKEGPRNISNIAAMKFPKKIVTSFEKGTTFFKEIPDSMTLKI